MTIENETKKNEVVQVKFLDENAEELVSKLKILFKGVKRSPIYNLSMADKELFHSNMLAWIFEEYPKVVKELFKVEDEVLIKQVDRERKHFDLLITYNDKSHIVVENKVKSIPSKAQLDRYTESASKVAELEKTDTTFFLLSLIKPNWIENFDNQDSNNNQESVFLWKYISFEDVVLSISKIKPFQSPYYEFLINDYIVYCTFLINCVKVLEENKDTYFLQRIGDNRFDSMLIKWHYSIMMERILEKGYFQNKHQKDFIVNSGEIGKIKVGSSIAPKSKKGILEFHYIVDFEKKNKDELNSLLFYGIQIEGNEFRIFIDFSRNKEHYCKYDNLSYCTNNENTEMWLDFIELDNIKKSMENVFTNSSIQGLKNKSKNRTKGLAKSYSGVFFYKNYHIIDNVKQNDVFDLVEKLFSELDNILSGKKWSELVNKKMKSIDDLSH